MVEAALPDGKAINPFVNYLSHYSSPSVSKLIGTYLRVSAGSYQGSWNSLLYLRDHTAGFWVPIFIEHGIMCTIL